MSVGELTPRQQATLDFVKGFYREHGYEPTMRDIAAGIGVASRSNAHRHVQALEQEGYVERRMWRGQTLYRPVDRTSP
jgi:SOS-response transcriptional repressor LexA